MARLLGLALCVSLLVLVGATAIGRALDNEAQDRVIFTRNGVTLDCVRHVRSDRVTYEDGNSYITSMAKGITLEEATKYFLGQRITQQEQIIHIGIFG